MLLGKLDDLPFGEDFRLPVVCSAVDFDVLFIQSAGTRIT